MLIFVSVSIVGSNFFQSIGKARLAIVLSLLRQLILLVPLILILPRLMGLDGVWLAQPIFRYISHYHYPHMFNLDSLSIYIKKNLMS